MQKFFQTVLGLYIKVNEKIHTNGAKLLNILAPTPTNNNCTLSITSVVYTKVSLVFHFSFYASYSSPGITD